MTLKLSNRAFTALPLLGSIALVAACSSSSTAANPNSTGGAGGLPSSGGASATAGTGGEAGIPACPDFMGTPVVGPGPGSGCGDGICFSCITPVEGMSFAMGTFSNTDDSGVTTATLRTESGQVCMSGTSVGHAILSLILGTFDNPFDTTALGITQVEFTIETSPTVGVVPQFAALLPDSSVVGFELTSAGLPESLFSTSTVRAPLTDFRSPGHTLDPSQVLAFGLTVTNAEHYDFCVSDLKFLDANDVEVGPTP